MPNTIGYVDHDDALKLALATALQHALTWGDRLVIDHLPHASNAYGFLHHVVVSWSDGLQGVQGGDHKWALYLQGTALALFTKEQLFYLRYRKCRPSILVVHEQMKKHQESAAEYAEWMVVTRATRQSHTRSTTLESAYARLDPELRVWLERETSRTVV